MFVLQIVCVTNYSALSLEGGKIMIKIILLLTFQSLFAETFTLDKALNKIGDSPSYKQAQSQADEATWKKVETFSVFLPSVSLTGNYYFTKKYAVTDFQFAGAKTVTEIPQVYPTSAFILNGQWLLFDGFANIHHFQAARYEDKAAQENFQWNKFYLEREVVLQFYQALAAKKLYEVAEQNLKTLNDHLEDSKLLRKAGMSTKFDLLRVEVKQSTAESDLLSAQDNVSIAQMRLFETLGMEENFNMEGEFPIFESNLIKDLKLDEERHDIMALKDRARAADSMSSAESRFWVPKVSLIGQYQQYNNKNDDWKDKDAYRDAYAGGVNLTWNVFDGFATYSKYRESRERQIQAEYALAVAQNKSKTNFEFWKRKFLYYLSMFKARQNDLDKATESVRLSKEARKVGTNTNSDLLDAELELFRARADLVNAQLGTVESLINLELVSGKKLYTFR